MNNPLPLLLAVLTIIGECLWSAIQQVGELLTSPDGFIGEFITCESGHARPQQALPVAWTGGLLIAATVVLGAPDTARAEVCSEVGGSCTADWQCATFCASKNCTDLFWCNIAHDECVCKGT